MASTGVATKEEFQSDQMQSASVPGRLPTTVKPTDDAEAFRPREKQITGLVGAEGGQKTPQSTGENGEYARQIIFQLGNQMQVRSLDELVTLVVQVVDARRLNAVPTGAAELAPAQPPTQQSKPD